MLAGACQIVGPFIVLAQMSTLPSCPLHNTISSHHQAILASNPFGFDLMRYLRASSRKIITTANAKGRKMNSTGTPCARQPIPTSSFAPPASISAQVKHSLSFERLAARMGHRRRGTRIQRSQAWQVVSRYYSARPIESRTGWSEISNGGGSGSKADCPTASRRG